MRTNTSGFTIFLLALVFLVGGPATAAVEYQIHDLCGIQGYMCVYDVGASGVAVGTAGTAGGYDHAFYWSGPAGAVDLGTYGGGTISGAKSINRLGDIAGFSYVKVVTDGQESQALRAVVWRHDGSAQCLGMLPGADSSGAHGINDLGQVVGFAFFGSGLHRHVVIWQPDGSITDLGQLFNDAYWSVLGINNAGQILGYALGGTGFEYWLRGPDGAYTYLQNPTSDYIDAGDLNDSGLVAGTTHIARNAYRATLWNPDGTIRRLFDPLANTQASMGYGLNSTGEVVGESMIIQDDGSIVGNRATVWGTDGAPVDLGALPGQSYSTAWGIGDNGCIVGCSAGPGSRSRVVYWTPVPEPPGALALILPLGVLAWRRASRRAPMPT